MAGSAAGVYKAGVAFLEVVPSFNGVEGAFKDLLRTMGAKLDAETQAGIRRGLRDGSQGAGAQGKKAADDFSGAFNRDVHRDLDKAVRNMGDRTASSFDETWNKAFHKVGEDLRDLKKERIGFTIDEDTFAKSVENMRNRMRTLEDNAPSASSYYDANASRRDLDSVLGTIDEARRRGKDQGQAFAGAFDTELNETLTKSHSRMKPIKLDADSSEAERTVEQLRADIATLSGKRIGIDISSAEAMAEVARIEAALRLLDRDDVEVDVRVNSRRAADDMKRFRESADDSSRSVSNIERAASLSMTRLGYLIALGASLGSVLVPAAAAAAAAIGFIGTGAAAAAAGVGVLALGLHGIGGAIQAMQKLSEDQNDQTTRQTKSNAQLTNSADAVRQAELTLGNTRRQVSDQQADSARKVQDAVRGVESARHDEGIAARDSARQVADAQRDLTRAESDAKDTRLALNAAIVQARKDMKDLSTELDRNQVDQQKAVTAQIAALNELHALQANPRSSLVELRRAKDSYDEQTVKLEELKGKRKDLIDQQEKQTKLGVEGDAKVIAAHKAVAAADQRAGDARVKVQRAQQDAAERTHDANAKIAEAEGKVADARRDQDRQRIQGAFQIAQAEHGVTAAARAQDTAVTQAGTNGAAAIDNLTDAMAKLTPSQQTFARFIFGLKGQLKTLQAAAADPMLPGLQKAIEMLLPYLPGVASFVSKIAAELGSMAVQAAKALKGPMWQRFFDYIDQTAVPAMQMWWDIAGNVVQGLANIYLALTQFDGQVGRGLVGLSEDFAKWSANLGSSKGFQKFVEYVRTNGPEVVDMLGSLAKLAVRLLIAFAPIGAIAMKVLDGIADGLNHVPMPVLVAVVGAIAALSIGLVGLGGILRAQKLKTELASVFGGAARSAVQKYAIDTGRATAETGKFRTVMATMSGAASKYRDSIGGIPAKVGAAFGNANSGLIGRMAHQSGLLRVEGGKLNTAFAAMGGVAVSGAKKMGSLARSVGGLKGAFGSLGSFLGGPWGIAMIGATVAITYFTSQSQKQKDRVSALQGGLGELSDRYLELAKTGQQAGAATDETFQNIINNDPEMKKTLITLNELGVSVDTMMKALTSGDPSAVINALNGEMQRLDDEMRQPGNFFKVFDNEKRAKRIDELDAMKTAFLEQAKAMGLGAQAQDILNAADQRNSAITAIKNAHMKDSADVVDQLITKYDEYGTKINHLNSFLNAFSGGTTDVESRAQALRDVIDDQTKSMADAQTAADDYQSKLLSLRDAMKQNHGAIKDNSQAAIDNRKAVKDAASASREMYIQEAAAGKPMAGVTQRHKDRIAALIDEAKKGGLNSKAVQGLIDIYGKVPDNVQTSLETKNFTAVYKELQKMRYMQFMLSEGKSAEDAEKAWKQEQQAAAQAQAHGFGGGMSIPDGKATGGPISGPGTGTSDDVLIRASDGEHMLTAKEVQAAGGHDAVYAWRKAILAGLELPRHATGGAIRKKHATSWPYAVNMVHTKVPTQKQIEDAVAVQMGGSPLGTTQGGAGWQWQQSVLQAAFGNARVSSSTGGGHAKNSWHYKGRAIDIVPHTREIMQWIHDTYGATTLELIGPYKDLDLWHGKPHQYSAALNRQHESHIHWAYDNGGMLQPGAQQVVNLTGKPEPVLTQPQWAAVEDQNDIMRQLVSQANSVGGRGSTYNFEFANTTLDAARLRAMQQRDDALNRVGRSR